LIGVDAASFLVIVATAAVAALAVTIVGPRVAIPVVVVELLLGIVVGPRVAGLAHLDPATESFGNLGLGMLFFFAGYEIDFDRVRGQPLRLGLGGWVISLALLCDRGRARGGGHRRLRPLHGIRYGDDGHRDAAPNPERHR
jgi:Kef-type K+ transport system membrane component KefB